MNRNRRQQIEALFERALDLEASRRSAWLANACHGDESLVHEVVALLAAHERAAGLLEADAVRAAAAVAKANRVSTRERIGPYRLDGVIAEGGMGVVYRAERSDGQFSRRVAIKLIRSSPDLSELHRRFEVERQILASLDHPNIASLLDGGMTDDGLPYLVMEYVDGSPIDQYCAQNRLGVDDILELFRTVARAVQHAHRNLVVHRDLKPSNVFVTSDGVVKLLDFGIAKILDPSLFGQSAEITRTGLRLMTPAYASPEQLTGGTITTATDVYGLGVVLYQLLTGSLPFDLDGCTPGECERVILNDEPRRPSSQVMQLSAASPDGPVTVAPPDRLQRRLHRRLRGDLDRIVLMALRKEPERRFASAGDFADDIDRHLTGKPVRARTNSATYRARKFMYRHRWGVAAAVLVAVSLIGGTLATAWQARRASRQAAIASDERDRATTEAAKAARVAGLMLDLFRLSDPSQTLGDTVTAREVLDRGTERIEHEFSDQPEVQAELLLDVARVYANLGLLSRAETLIRRSLQLREDLFGRQSLETSESFGQLGRVLAVQGRREEAIAAYRAAVTIRGAVLDHPDTLLAHYQASLGWEVRAEGSHDEAAELFRRALDVQIVALGEESPQVAATMLGLASAYHDRGSFEQAEQLFQQALERLPTGRATPHPLAATALLNIGMLRRLREQYLAAEPMIESALKMRTALYDPDHHMVIEAMKEWGQLLYYLGRYGAADRVLRDALARADRVLGPEHDHTITIREALAITLTLAGRYEEALAIHDSSRIVKQAHSSETSLLATILRSGRPLLELGRLREADARFREGLSMTGPTSVYRVIALRGAAQVAHRQGRYDESERLFQQALAIAAERLRPNHRYTLATEQAFAGLLIDLGRHAEAVAILEKVVADRRAKFREPHPEIGHSLHYLGQAYLGLNDAPTAEQRLQAALRNYQELPPHHWWVGDATSLLGAAAQAQGRQAEARPLLEDGLRIVRGHVGSGVWQERRAVSRLGAQ
jgi:serine/threonine-protein kinase